MAEETTNPGGTGGGIPTTDTSVITNLKAEMDRKLDNINTVLKQTTETLKTQLAAMKQPAPQPTPTPSSVNRSFKDKFYEDEDAALNEVKEIAKTEMRSEWRAAERQKEVINRLYNDFPEIADTQNPLTRRAIEIYDALPPSEKENPQSYRAAVLDAAAELQVVPARHRKRETTDEYTGGGSATPGRTPKGELDPRTVAFAQAVGLNIEDPKVMENLKKRAERSDWNAYR